ncbi:type VI secretion system baseplate subunit TssK [Hydromonas duriensis]|uniref:Type VI secretion system protein ImpJ n=1 Tax=Hydromonas duriensis TaxID=1527608 RepID=A0A4R6Y9H3_9BURK|nr:type VI secretion system baseplate subunit TssK [Hydromonas duriensis]TDR32126.1 type VI secretion system protein ImpJ [Hydromonas duriensis]
MGWYNKIVWTEGLFMRPQHLQQQERYLEHYAHRRSLTLSPFFWGISHYAIDTESLNLGKIVLKSATGLFIDGTPFDAPGHMPLPQPLKITHELLEQEIFLATPARLPNSEETAFEEDAGRSLARNIAFEYELRDSNSIGMGSKLVQMSHLRLKLVPAKEMGDAWVGLPIAKVSEILSDGSIRLDSTLIPPVTGFAASQQLKDWLIEIHGLTNLRADALAKRLVGTDVRSSQVAEVTDYFILQLLNRYQPLLKHLLSVPETSPEELYQTLLQLAGEMSTFVNSKTRRPEVFPEYDHLHPRFSIEPLVLSLRHLLNVVLERSAQMIELENRPHGVYLAVLSPNELESFGSIVLGVQADLPKEMLQQQFISQAKVAPFERLIDLVRSHLPGIELDTLPVAPRQIPFNSGYTYFEVSQTGKLWEQLEQSGGLAMHIAGNFPGLKMELWGIRDR